MKYLMRSLIVCLLSFSPLNTWAENEPAIVQLHTTLGMIEITLDAENAPKTALSFWKHAKEGFYDGLIFHRVIADYTIQSGAYTSSFQKQKSNHPMLNSEADNGLQNLRGSVAMARRSNPHSARNQFFINVNDNAALNHKDTSRRGWGYTVFGQVTAGMDIVDAIQKVQTKVKHDFKYLPIEAVIINEVNLIGKVAKVRAYSRAKVNQPVADTPTDDTNAAAEDEMRDEADDNVNDESEDSDAEDENTDDENVEDEEDLAEDDADIDADTEEDADSEEMAEEDMPRSATLTKPTPQPKAYKAAKVPALSADLAPELPDTPAVE